METLDIYTYVVTSHFHFEEYLNTLDVFATFGMHWEDNRLKWNASDWSEIEQILPKHDEIWMPHFEIIK
uniref:Neurotransmitter-gated ion-channel ligand-binding domain-containing protein n=1 Tax=Anopheles atroparvus TaxID=41427 RepID=A0AAG5DQP2_ANOAO